MKTLLRLSILGLCCAMMLILDVAFLQLAPDANAVLGVRRRTARRTAVVVGSASASESAQSQQQVAAANQQTAAAQQQAADANQQAAAANQKAADAEAEAAAAKQQAAAAQAAAAPPAPPPTSGPLPLGTVVSALPSGCTSTTSGGVEYYKCGSNYYKAAFQGSQLVYVTAQP